MRFLGLRAFGGLRRRGRVLPPAARPWLTDLSALCPYPGLEPGDLPEFTADPDWSAWEIGDTPAAQVAALRWLAFEVGGARLFVADRMLMSRVSWADLDAAGYVHGREIAIDGARWRIRRPSLVLIVQRLGFSIAEIRAALATLPDRRTPTKADWARLSRQFRQHLDHRIAGLTALRDRLDGCIGCGRLSLELCALHNPNDAAAAIGDGPRYLLNEEKPAVSFNPAR